MIRRFLVAALLSLMAGCGGGGGDNGPAAPTGYTGNTAQAQITPSNAKTIALGAYSGGDLATSFGMLKTTNTASAPNQPMLHEVVQTLQDSMASLPPAQKQAAKVASSTASVQDTVYGYSGSFSYAFTASDSGAASGTIVYNAYKSDSYSAVVNGTVSFSATYNQSTGAFSRFSMTFTGLTASAVGESVAMSGTMVMSVSGYTSTATLNMLLTDNMAQRTYGLSNYQMVVTEGTNGTSLTLSGTYYDSVNGYVVISTVTPITTSYFSYEPDAGVLLFSGSNGTRARLTFTGSGYIVEADTGTGFVVVQ